MGMAFLYYVAFLFFGFVAMYASFAPQANKFEKVGRFSFFMQPILYVFIIFTLSSIGAFFLADTSDFITPLDLVRIVLPLILVPAIYATAFLFGEKSMSLAVILSLGVCVFLTPLEAKFVPFGWNEFVFKILAVIYFSVFCLGYKVLNYLPHTISVASITMLLGVSLLSAIGGAPVYLALISAALIGALSAYLGVNLHKVKIEFDTLSCVVLAFLLSNIFMFDMGEMSFGSCLIFSMVFWAEWVFAVWKKLFISKSGNLIENSHIYMAAQKLTLATLMSNIFKVGLVCLFFGWFQLFSVNQYSLPIISFFVALWLSSSMGANLIQTPKTLKQINAEFVADIKQNLKETKDTISQISSKKDD